jgi:hypothetical protein
MECRHGDLRALAVRAGEDALAALEDLVVGGVPALDDLQSAVDLAPEMLISWIVAGEDRS